MTSGLVSIIIPAYNRSDLIGETLDSIISQTYVHWECLVIDDGSTDSTVEVVTKYARQDSRIKLLQRPISKPKGANACRNIGLNAAQGEYVVFFDSDDLMTKNHIEVKVNAIKESNCDYVITKTQYFNFSNVQINKNYQFDIHLITSSNYISQKINWLTLDVCIISSIAKSISFNERLYSGQEYNYFSKLVYKSTNAQYINKVLSLRRYHDGSIRRQLESKNLKTEGSFRAKWYTYLDLKEIADRESKVHLMDKCVNISYNLKSIPIAEKFSFTKEVFQVYGYKGVYFIFMMLGLRVFNRGYYFRKKLLAKKI